MQRDLAQRLAFSLRSHLVLSERVDDVDASPLVSVLEQADLPERQELKTSLPANIFTIQDGTETYHQLSLRRILRKGVVIQSYGKGDALYLAKQLLRLHFEMLSPELFNGRWKDFFGYSSDRKVRRLLSHGPYQTMMFASYPFFLLAKLETHEGVGDAKNHLTVTRPILAIPGAEGVPSIVSWENSEEHYEHETGRLWMGPVRTSREKYEEHRARNSS